MYVVCSDLESVYIPEIWVGVAEKTGIEELKITTRDEPDYDKLMKRRIKILEENNLTIEDIKEVINKEDPFDGAKDFLDWVRSKTRLIVVSDTFTQFAEPMMKKLGYPTLFCNSLIIGEDGMIKEHVMRQDNGKQKVIEAIKSINFKTIAIGDSYNDVNMLLNADFGILFRPPENVKSEYPQLPVAENYEDLKKIIEEKIK